MHADDFYRTVRAGRILFIVFVERDIAAVKTFLSHPVVTTMAKVLISIGLLWALLSYIDIASILHSFANANIVFLGIGFGLALLQLVVHLYRWRFLLRLVSRDIPDSEVVTSFFVGFMAGFFTPAQVGEIAGRIASHPDLKTSHVVGITLIDKLYWAALTLVIGGAGISIFIVNHFSEYWHPAYRYIITGTLGILIAVFLYPDTVKQLLKFLPERIRNHRFYEMIQVLENEFHNTQAWITFGLTGLLYSVILTEYYFLANAFEPVALGDLLMCAGSVFFVKSVILPISFGDLGVRESAAVFFFEKAGTSAAMAFNASLIMSFANVILPTAIGAILVTTIKRKLR